MPNDTDIMYMVKESDLSELKGLIVELKDRITTLEGKKNIPANGGDILTSKDIMNDLGISRKSLDRRLYEWENPIPMVLEGHKLKIRRDKYEAWKKSIGL